jgi:hypothetical protein
MSAELDFRMVRVCCIALELDTPPVTPARLGDGLPDGNMTKRTSADWLKIVDSIDATRTEVKRKV